MTQSQLDGLKHDFLQWSGGFEPESREEITVYIDYACSTSFDPEDARLALLDWMTDTHASTNN